MTVIILAAVLITAFLQDYKTIWPSAPMRSRIFYIGCMGIAAVCLYASATHRDITSPLKPITEFFLNISSQ